MKHRMVSDVTIGAAETLIHRKERGWFAMALALLALSGCSAPRASDLDWGPWRFDESIVSAVCGAADSLKAERLASRIDCLSVKVVSDDRFRWTSMRDLMDEPDDFTTRDRAEIARIIAALAEDGSRETATSLPRPAIDVLILLFDRTLMSYACIYANETNDVLRWSFTSAQLSGVWTSARAESTLSAMGIGHSVHAQ